MRRRRRERFVVRLGNMHPLVRLMVVIPGAIFWIPFIIGFAAFIVVTEVLLLILTIPFLPTYLFVRKSMHGTLNKSNPLLLVNSLIFNGRDQGW